MNNPMHTVTETIFDEMNDPIVGAGSTISETLICTLYDTHGIDRLEIGGSWFRVMFPTDKYGRRQLRLRPDFSAECASFYE